MSTNKRNKTGFNFLKAFTENKESRNIILEDDDSLSKHTDVKRLEKELENMNEEITKIIQNLNYIICDRQLPYVNLIVERRKVNSTSRIILQGNNNTNYFIDDIIEQINENQIEPSHFIDILFAAGYKEIKESISSDKFSAQVSINRVFFECILLDMLLDISMFNSYSFLRDMPPEEKYLFSYKKYRYYNKKNLKCFYNYKKGNKDLYFSFAFSARTSENEIDIQEYISLWNDFIAFEYPSHVHKELSIEEQLKYHVDSGQISKVQIL